MPDSIDVTTVTDTTATVHFTPGAGGAVRVIEFDGLAPDSAHDLRLDDVDDTCSVHTLRSLAGAPSAVFATVNDVHFGETVAGQIDDLPNGPLRRSAEGKPPYPEVMNRAAVAEMTALGPDAVVVKGDLSLDGAPEEWAAFEACYRSAFADRLHVVRGNHDAYRHQGDYAGDHWIELDGISIALLDTTIPGHTTGTVLAAQLDWLDEHAAASTQPVIAMGHHQQWIDDVTALPHERTRSDDYFGLHPDASDALDAVCARHPAIIAYAAGHTHRHRVRTMTASGIPSIEVGCTKDFPGTWAEYRAHPDGLMQVVHRMSSAEALAWSESCRHLYADFDVDYESYALGKLSDRCFIIPFR